MNCYKNKIDWFFLFLVAFIALIGFKENPVKSFHLNELTKQGVMEIEISTSRRRFFNDEINTSKNNFFNNEDMIIKIRMINNSNESIVVPDPVANMNWQPIYTLKGPSYTPEYNFSLSDIYGSVAASSGQMPYTTEILPGDVYETELSLESWASFPETGTHTLIMNLNWNGVKAQSNEIAINIEPVNLLSCQLIVEPDEDSASVNVYCLRTSNTGVDIIRSELWESPGDMGSEFDSMSIFSSVGYKAQNFFVSLASIDGIIKRHGVLNEKTLSLIGFGKKPSEITLDYTPELILPATSDNDGNVNLSVFNPVEKTLSMVAFPSIYRKKKPINKDPVALTLTKNADGSWMHPSEMEGAPKSEPEPKPDESVKILWTVPLTHVPISSRASISVSGGTKRRAMVLVAQSDTGSVITLLRVAKDASTPEQQQIEIKGVHAVKSSEPAIQVDINGNVNASVMLFSTVGGAAKVEVVLYEFFWANDKNSDKSLIETKHKTIATLPALPLASAISYGAISEILHNNTWVILLDNNTNQVIHPNYSGKTQTLSSPAILPLQLLSIPAGKFLLVEDKEKVFDLQLLH